MQEDTTKHGYEAVAVILFRLSFLLNLSIGNRGTWRTEGVGCELCEATTKARQFFGGARRFGPSHSREDRFESRAKFASLAGKGDGPTRDRSPARCTTR
jgi:hypothetical protein